MLYILVFVMYYLGIDCGTQGTKAIILDSDSGELIARGYAKHDIIADDSGRREQDARWWIEAMTLAVTGALAKSGIDGKEIKAMAVSGQQHGCVMLDGQGAVIRNVKLWNDTSTASWNAALIEESGGVAGVWKTLGQPLPVGYTASKVRFHAEREKELYSRVKHILLPHDYINFYLTGNYLTEGSEASGTGYYDVNARVYSKTMMDRIDPSGILEQAVPPVYSWKRPAGTLRREAAQKLGLSEECLVAAGGGDATMAAAGTAAIMEGCCSAGIGTSGIVSVLSPVMGKNIDPVIQIFEVLDDKWLIVSCTMNATSATTLVQNLFGLSVTDLNDTINRAPAGSRGVQVIPFFDGERIPALPSAFGMFRNLTSLNCRQENIFRATVEAATYTMRWGFDKITASFPAPSRLIVTGGGANSSAWRQILADVFNLRVIGPQADEGGALGAALQALYLHRYIAGSTVTLQELCERYVRFDPSKEANPIPKNAEIYRELFASYKETIRREWGDGKTEN